MHEQKAPSRKKKHSSSKCYVSEPSTQTQFIFHHNRTYRIISKTCHSKNHEVFQPLSFINPHKNPLTEKATPFSALDTKNK